MKTHLGDGVYADVDAYGNVILSTEIGVDTTNEIVLEPEVIGKFQRFLEAAHDTILERLST